MKARWPFTIEKIAARLSLIAPHVHRRAQPLAPFRLLPLAEASITAPICADPQAWEEIPHQSYWGHADLNFILKSHFTVPDGWDADHIALHLPLGVLGDIFNHPEGLVHIDTQPIGSADRYHHTVPLDAKLQDGARHVVSLLGWTGHAGWPPDPHSKAKLFMGTPQLVERDPALTEFCGLAQAALDAAKTIDPDSAEHHGLLAALDAAVLALDTRAPIGEALYQTAPAALDILRAGIAQAGDPLDVTLHGIGHAHMDIAYLWPISQIRLKNARTYSNVLRLMEEDDDYHFSHTQPQLYDYTAQDYPEIFAQIKERVAQGRWEVLGGMWVEPDLNIPGGEALVRQLTLGRAYFKETFGDVETPALWLPDTFGFPAQIPQLMKQAGLRWFVTNKLNWNQRNKVPSSTHHWEGLDGSRVLAHVLTTPRDVQYLPFPTNYKSDLSAAEVLGTWETSTAQDSITDLPICFGYGDGGGGPTEDLLAKAHAYAAMPGMPKMKMGTVRTALEAIESAARDLPVWQGEHYMEGHRGVFTSQGWIKRANRKAEWALHEAEALAAMAGMTPDLTKAWQLLCLNQFHDIITGTSVPQVFADARKDYASIMQMAQEVAAKASAKVALDDLAVANTSPVAGPRLVFVPETAGAPAQGQPVEGGTLCLFSDLPPYALTPVGAASTPAAPATCRQEGALHTLENAYIRAEVGANGQLVAVFDKASGRHVLAKGQPANQLQAFEDRPICWDAWDIDPSFEDRQDLIDAPCAIEIIEDGPLRAALRLRHEWRGSTITQDIRLAAHSGRIDFETRVDWHERQTLLKVAFPTCIDADQAEFDIQWGRIARSTRRDTAFDAARFEVPAHKWAKLTEERVTGDGLTVAVLNDCKYGYDVRAGTIRLTLIKSSTSPDPTADQGAHHFTYSLLTVSGDGRQALDQQAYDLNAPARIVPASVKGAAPSAAYVTGSAPNVIVETVKPAADGQGVVLRLFEAWGQAGETTLTLAKAASKIERVTLSEERIADVAHTGHDIPLTLRPFEIVTLRITY